MTQREDSPGRRRGSPLDGLRARTATLSRGREVDEKDFPSWRLLRPQPRWRRYLSKIAAGNLVPVALTVIGVFMVVWGVIFFKPLDLSVVDAMMDAPAYTFYSDRTGPRPGAIAPDMCASRVPGSAPSPDAVIGTSGASRPGAFEMIECAKADLEATRLHGAAGAPWGTSRNVIDALIAQEDRDFWSRRGVNVRELLSAASAMLDGRGGSNLSMQIIKNLYFPRLRGEGSWARRYRNLYERTHQAELEEHLKRRLVQQSGGNGRTISPFEIKASILSLYLQSASRVLPDPDSQAGQNPCHTDSASLSRPKCVELYGVAHQAKRSYGKRLDQLTIAEAASVVAGLRGGRYGIDAPENDRRESCAELRDELRLQPAQVRRIAGGVFNNRCMAEHIIKVMANDPSESGRGWLRTHNPFQRGLLEIEADQLPDDMKDDRPALITRAQEAQAIAELNRLARCGLNAHPESLDIEGRQQWCDVEDSHEAVKNLAPHYLNWVMTQLPPPRTGYADFAVYTTLDPDTQRAAVATLSEARRTHPDGDGPPPPALAALVTMDAQGRVKALTGLAAAGRGALPGSTLKPFIFAAYLEKVMAQRGPGAAAAAFEDQVWANDCEGIPVPYVEGIGWPMADQNSCSKPRPGQALAWLPDNAAERGERGFKGGCDGVGSNVRGSLHEALCRSLNTVTAEVAISLGRQPIATRLDQLNLKFFDSNGRAGRFPVTSWNQSIIGEGSATIRPLELAAAYTVFLNDGRVATPSGIRDVFAVAQSHRLSAVGSELPDPPAKPVFSPEVMRIVDRGLLDVVEKRNGTASKLQLENFHVAGKTGTVEGDGVRKPREIWFVGYRRGEHPEVTVIWLSYYYPKGSRPQGDVRKVRDEYGRHAAEIYRTYLEKRESRSAGDAP